MTTLSISQPEWPEDAVWKMLDFSGEADEVLTECVLLIWTWLWQRPQCLRPMAKPVPSIDVDSVYRSSHSFLPQMTVAWDCSLTVTPDAAWQLLPGHPHSTGDCKPSRDNINLQRVGCTQMPNTACAFSYPWVPASNFCRDHVWQGDPQPFRWPLIRTHVHNYSFSWGSWLPPIRWITIESYAIWPLLPCSLTYLSSPWTQARVLFVTISLQ